MFSPTTTGETRDGAKEDEQEGEGERTASESQPSAALPSVAP